MKNNDIESIFSKLFNKPKPPAASGELFVVAGLGNPGAQYCMTRHNAGYTVIDYLAKKHGIKVTAARWKGLIGDGEICGKRVLLVKPTTYMNNSGECIRPLCDYYKIPPERLLVVYDDIDLPLGSIRLREKGSAGTHNGMRSIISNIGNGDFPRLRLGINGDRGQADLKGYVIGNFTEYDLPIYKEAVIEAAAAVEKCLELGVERAMSACNSPKKKEEK